MNNKNLNEYNSIEEFIFKHNRYPNTDESRELYRILWNNYIASLDDSEKKIAIINDSSQDYENGKAQEQKEIIKLIAASTKKMKIIFGHKKDIISINYDERWGIYSIYVQINCYSKRKLYEFRKVIPIFFEGWEVKIIRANFLQRAHKTILDSLHALFRRHPALLH